MEKIRHLETKFTLARYELIIACDANELQLYLYLKLYAINKSSAFPSSRTISTQLGWSREKLFNTIKLMEHKKRLRTSRKKGKNNIYDITWYDETNQSGNQTTTGTETRPLVVRKPDTNYKKVTRRNKTKQNFNFKGQDLGFLMT